MLANKIDTEKMYEENEKFRQYVDKYCNTYRISVQKALEHALVQEVAESYAECSGKEEQKVVHEFKGNEGQG